MYSILLILLVSNSVPIHTTVADSSLVAFTIDTQVSFDSVSHDGDDYIRFIDIPVTDSIGYPEVPVLLCMVAIPDSVEPSVSWSFHGEESFVNYPVYPAPKDSVIHVRTPEVIEVFKQDSTAYASDEWWPADKINVAGEMRLFDQRLLLIEVYPVSFLASEDSIRTAAGFSVAVSFDSTEADWSSTGLGPFQPMVEDSPIIGYHPVEQSRPASPRVYRNFDLIEGPSSVPEYVILTATGLDGWWIDSLAWHRVDLNGFDVGIVTTEEVMNEFGTGSPALTPDIIRDFTEAMWAWGHGSPIKPSYFLLVGDHEDASFGEEGWFLPTFEYKDDPRDLNSYANDEWYVYFNQPRSVENAMPDMMVGRLCVKGADTLQAMIDNIIEYEQPLSSPESDNLRRIVRLAGTGHENDQTHIQSYKNWGPTKEWTEDFCDWLGYDYSTTYCGDGRDWTVQDESILSSREWVASCINEFSNGAGLLFYSNHGDFHMLSAGLEWVYDPGNLGNPDSSFNCLHANELSASQDHYPPFVLLLCCTAGTFNHTQALHPDGNGLCCLCMDPDTTHPEYDYTTDCIAEAVLKNTDCPVAGVFAGSLSSFVYCYDDYGEGILESIYCYGQSRLGESIAGARLRHNITGRDNGQFNLLGDPALDIGDRLRYPDKCDLVIYSDDIIPSNYPRETRTGFEEDITVTVRNNGGASSVPFTLRLTITGTGISVFNLPCAGLQPGEEQEYDFTWDASWFNPPEELTFVAVADPAEQCDDCWRGNNTATVTKTLYDIYPSESEWPIEPVGVVQQPPLLVNLDTDPELEIVVLSNTYLEAYDTDNTLLWRNDEVNLYHFNSPLAADLDGDGNTEILAATTDYDVVVFNKDGELLYTLELQHYTQIAVSDMDDASGLELVIADQKTLYLYSWNPAGNEFTQIKSITFMLNEFPSCKALICSDLNDDGYCETVYYCCYNDELPGQSFYSLLVYDWCNDTTLSERIWNYDPPYSIPCAGILGGSAEIGFPMGSYDPQSAKEDSVPAQLLDPLSVDSIICEKGLVASSGVRFGLFADWDEFVPGLDAFIIPAENQCLAWNEDGRDFSDEWHVYYDTSYTYSTSGISPPALGDLDNDGIADVLSSTLRGENGLIVGLNYLGDEPENIDFPFLLPEGVDVSSGFSIADIDRDGKVEIVFGTGDGLLHCWELGTCSEGYAPWPQHRHDAGRSGVLE